MGGSIAKHLKSAQSEGVVDKMEDKMKDMMSSLGIQEDVVKGTTMPPGAIAAPQTPPPPAMASIPNAGVPALASVNGTAPQVPPPLTRRLPGTTTVTTCVPVNVNAQVAQVGIPGKACTNPADIKIYQSMGMAGFHQIMNECAKKCLTFAKCVADCHQQKLGFSPACAGCFGNMPGCTMLHCPFQCATDSEGCGKCSTASCIPDFEKCAGLNPDNRSQFGTPTLGHPGVDLNGTTKLDMDTDVPSALFSLRTSSNGATQHQDLTTVAVAAACLAAVCAAVAFLASARGRSSWSVSARWRRLDTGAEEELHGEVEAGMLTRIASHFAE